MHVAEKAAEEKAEPRAARFAGRAALVTHADHPLGAAAARRLADEGATVFTFGTTSGAAFEGPEAGARLVEQALATTGGRLDVLVVGTGCGTCGTFASQTLSGWRALMDVELRAQFLLCQAAAAPLAASGDGAIVAFTATPAGVAAGAASAGLISLTRALAVELGPRVRANAVRVASAGASPEAGDQAAAAIAFLASGDAAYTTGQTLDVLDAGGPQ